MKEALFYQQLENNKVICELCPHLCKLNENQIGNCNVRKNLSGKLFSLLYGKSIAMHVDPIEKKPLFHVAPGSRSFSMATAGCNFFCKFCQNSDISQVSRSINLDLIGQKLSPTELVAMAVRNNCLSIAYTYTEPTIYFEYAYDTAKIAHQQGLLNVFVTNGFINPEPLQYIHEYLDAANVDLKSFSDNFYKKLVGAKLSPVLETLKLMKKLNIWVEVTTLIIPGENDSDEELKQIAGFIKDELGQETPWHISRFYPQYKLGNHPPTPVSTLQKAYDIGKEQGLRYVYMGNVPGNQTESSFCYNCGEMIVDRYGYQIQKNNIKSGKCRFCGVEIDGVGM
ncbi:AmmeMemoRadiSam system radical SAM enzyme [candidate division KSB1 bacterium]|nr:AmmeMemoRadiSam system radical SAM enzyme [candidate division KSB1 bacterium]